MPVIALSRRSCTNPQPRHSLRYSHAHCLCVDEDSDLHVIYSTADLRMSEGSTGQIFATSSVIYQMKMWSLVFKRS